MAALHLSALRNHTLMASVLIDVGTDLSLQMDNGDTALHTAAYVGIEEIVDKLLSANADVEATNWKGLTPLDYAAKRGHDEILKKLLIKVSVPNSSFEYNRYLVRHIWSDATDTD